MKKYNLSDIMKYAWKLIRSVDGLTMSEALKTAWSRAKDRVEETVAKAKIIVNKHIKITFIAKWLLMKMSNTSFLALDAGMYIDDIILERETQKAIEISTEWNGGRMRIWLPKSACQYI